jgi:hypothetical protein
VIPADDDGEEKTPSDAAFGFLVTMVAGLLLLALVGIHRWSAADQWVAVVATFAVSGIVSSSLWKGSSAR